MTVNQLAPRKLSYPKQFRFPLTTSVVENQAMHMPKPRLTGWEEDMPQSRLKLGKRIGPDCLRRVQVIFSWYK